MCVTLRDRSQLMARVTVTPEAFTLVNFDSARIAELAEQLAEEAGIPADTEVRIEVDETNPFGRALVSSLEPVVIQIEGGAFEDRKRPKQMSEASIVNSLGRILLCTADRLSGACADAPADADLTVQQQTAWDAYALGRCERNGHPSTKPHRQYAFRNRHGFNDQADAVFERLWTGEGLTWADIEAACAETATAREVPAAS